MLRISTSALVVRACMNTARHQLNILLASYAIASLLLRKNSIDATAHVVLSSMKATLFV
jgi:hypothetical protein